MEPQWPTSNSLAGDADRERAIEALKQHFQAGRITGDELSDRIGLALNARTFGDLDHAMEQLPPLRPYGSAGRTIMPPVPFGASLHAPFPVRPGDNAVVPGAYSAYAQPAPRRRTGLAIASFALGMSGFLCGIPAIPGLGLGIMSLFTDSDRDDRGWAVAGIVTSVVWLGLFGLLFFG
ncbi:DUF1707 and DUF4190 domain-containing protein [Nocardia otitidiscaviarum]|uniref:DUF1707 and DUF4190 domain-containing protein n=1 Tax=Nocardia otitidiscaviarum TaxID=1823 RepID=UPI001895D0D1|nr:DUF1707 and DUF4190 domain-containing protein [Nocardia otitidiscaviarum]MBF6135939.1 DUF1707 and DUF4190 domain-containing protein [Nocardia otitidiscaviarum]